MLESVPFLAGLATRLGRPGAEGDVDHSFPAPTTE